MVQNANKKFDHQCPRNLFELKIGDTIKFKKFQIKDEAQNRFDVLFEISAIPQNWALPLNPETNKK